MSIGKWISDLTPGTAVIDAARRVLSVRLEVVRDQLALAIKQPEKDTEYVHQLRVGTRRARAALDIFACCLTEKCFAKARRFLRRLRRAAGAARDWDVFLLDLQQRLPAKNSRHVAGYDFLLGYGVGLRKAAQVDLEASAPDYPFSFDRFMADLLHALDKAEPTAKTLLDLARPTLCDCLTAFERAAAADLDNYENLHQVRIAGKRLRYAMEIFADCFSADFRDKLYVDIESMQEILGAANDGQVACTRLEELGCRVRTVSPAQWKRYKAGIEHLVRQHSQTIPKERERFLQWWKHWRDAGHPAMVRLLHRDKD